MCMWCKDKLCKMRRGSRSERLHELTREAGHKRAPEREAAIFGPRCAYAHQHCKLRGRSVSSCSRFSEEQKALELERTSVRCIQATADDGADATKDALSKCNDRLPALAATRCRDRIFARHSAMP